ncbi:MAG: tetratricopeptide repeat protein [Pseudomonadota bacterium]
MDDLTEDQQLERLKAWWAENGKAIVAGIALGGAGLFGWNQWQSSKDAAAMAASAQFDKAAEAAAESDLTLLKQAVTALENEHSGSAYVTQGQLQLAALHVERGEMEEAEPLLSAVFDATRGQPEHAIVGLRLARVQLYRENGGDALATLDGISDTRYASAVSELRGDILRAMGKSAEARDAYSDALNDPGTPPVIDAGMVEMKRASLLTTESDEAS